MFALTRHFGSISFLDSVLKKSSTGYALIAFLFRRKKKKYLDPILWGKILLGCQQPLTSCKEFKNSLLNVMLLPGYTTQRTILCTFAMLVKTLANIISNNCPFTFKVWSTILFSSKMLWYECGSPHQASRVELGPQLLSASITNQS